MNDRKPQPGDRVRVSYEGEYVQHENGARYIVNVDASAAQLWIPESASVEVLEPADDPSTDAEGTVRQRGDGIVAIKWSRNHWCRFDDEELRDTEVADWTVIGTVPGTPAAFLEEERKLDDEIPEWEQELIRRDYEERHQKREPRVFSSDGPEPPLGVKLLRSVEHPNAPYPFVAHCGQQWVLKESAIDSCHGHPHNDWAPQDWGLGDEFREVLDV